MIHLLICGESIFEATGENEPNSLLSENGIQQARNIPASDHERVFCSPLHRCIATLYNTSIKFKEIYVINELRDIMAGDCDLFFKYEFPTPEKEENILKRVEYIKNMVRDGDLLVTHPNFAFYLTSTLNEEGNRIGPTYEHGQIYNVSL